MCHGQRVQVWKLFFGENSDLPMIRTMLTPYQRLNPSTVGRREPIQRQNCYDFLPQDGIHFALGVLGQPIRKFLQLREYLLNPIISIAHLLARLDEVRSNP